MNLRVKMMMMMIAKKKKKKIAERNINNLKYVDNTTLMAESEEELKSLLMKVKTTFKNLRSWHLVPSLHGK